MKKTVLLIAFGILSAFTIISCGQSDSNASDKDSLENKVDDMIQSADEAMSEAQTKFEKEPYKSQYGAIALQAARVDGDQVHLKSEKTFFLYEDHAHEEAHVKSINDLAPLAEKNHILLSYKTLEGEEKVTPLKNLATQNSIITASVTDEASSFFKDLSLKEPQSFFDYHVFIFPKGVNEYDWFLWGKEASIEKMQKEGKTLRIALNFKAPHLEQLHFKDQNKDTRTAIETEIEKGSAPKTFHLWDKGEAFYKSSPAADLTLSLPLKEGEPRRMYILGLDMDKKPHLTATGALRVSAKLLYIKERPEKECAGALAKGIYVEGKKLHAMRRLPEFFKEGAAFPKALLFIDGLNRHSW